VCCPSLFRKFKTPAANGAAGVFERCYCGLHRAFTGTDETLSEADVSAIKAVVISECS